MTNDLQKAFDFALRSESGMVHVNGTTIAAMTEVKWITFQMGKRQFPC